MNKFLALALLLVASASPALAQEEVARRRQPKPEPVVTVIEAQNADVPAEIEIADGEKTRRYRLFPLRGDGEPRTEEYVDPAAPQPGVVGTAPPLAQPTGSRLERLGSIGDVLVPLLAALLGATAGPSAGSLVSKIWAAIRNKPPSSAPSGDAVTGVIRIAEVLKQLAPLITAIQQATPPTSTAQGTTPDETPAATVTPAK